MTDAAEIARSLHGRRLYDGFICRCPVPSHGRGNGDRTPSLLIKDGHSAVLFKCFAGCETADIIAEMRHRSILADDPDRRPAPARPSRPIEPEHNPDPDALALWKAAEPKAESKYLQARGINIAPPPSLRFGSDKYLERYPLSAIVAAVQAPDRRIIAVQITLLDPRGDRKAQVRLPRKTIGALGLGAVRLAGADDVIGLAEGVEKGLAAMQLFNIPCWASLGAQRMHRVRVPNDVRELHIFGDNDEAGRHAAERTAHAHKHRRVVLRFPPEQFKDWDDVTAAESRSAAA